MGKSIRRNTDKKYSDGSTSKREVREVVLSTNYCTCKHPFAVRHGDEEEYCENCGKEI